MNLHCDRLSSIALFVLLVLAFSESTLGVTRYVWQGGSSTPPYTNWGTASAGIRDAVYASTNSDVVLVTNGVCQDDNSIVISNAITLTSVNGATNTTIDHMSYNGRVLTATASGTKIEGFTITRGANAAGGGVYIGRGVELTSCIVISNSGCGVYADAGSLLTGCVVRLNSSAAALQKGAGVYCVTSTVRNCLIERNTAYYGGGVYCVGGSIRDCVIHTNVAYWGGGVTEGQGGGIYFEGGGTAENCRIEGNYLFGTVKQGGGAFLSGGGLMGQDGTRILHCVVTENTASNNGGGINFYGRFTVQNSIACSNTASSGPNWYVSAGPVSCSYSCITPDPGGTGNITDPPLFAGAETNDFRLQTNSPCIDAGTADYTFADFVRVPRPLDGNNDESAAPDIGAYEVVHPLADSESDGMPDWWEIAYPGLNPAQDDHEGDADGDRSDNLSEYHAGTDPTNSSSALGFESMSGGGGATGVVVRWQSVDGRRYGIGRATNLMSGDWVWVATNVLGVAPMNTVTDTTAIGSGPWIYRVELE